jgi:hypothetical protein
MFGQPAVNVRVTFYLTLGATRAFGETNGRRYAITLEHVLLHRSPIRQVEHSALGKIHDFKQSDPHRSNRRPTPMGGPWQPGSIE